jgi:flagellar assembly factor FliW
MNIRTRDFGEVEIIDEKIINFPDGIPGFETDNRFALLSPLGDNIYPMWLQSVDNDQTCFIVFNPYEIDEGYVLDDTQLYEELEVTEDTMVAVFTLSIIPEAYHDTTINLRCPIVINLETLTGKQIILEREYPVRYPVFAPITNVGD